MIQHALSRAAAVGIALLLCPLYDASAEEATRDPACAVGYYRLTDGGGVDLGYAGTGELRWRRTDGTSGLLTRSGENGWTSTYGWTGRADGVVVDTRACSAGEISFDGQIGHRVQFAISESRFDSDGTDLIGRLLLPPGDARVPVVVLVHGSEDLSALRYYALQRLLPAMGVGVFVYDKRGTGASAGTFTHDLYQLAADAAAALNEARNLAGDRLGRIGYYGTSQGGWTAPRAALLTSSDFVIVGYGLAVSPLDEDREALALDMTRHGFGQVEIDKALQIGAAAEAILRSGFQSGYQELASLRERDQDEPWFKHVRGNLTRLLLEMPEATLRQIGPTALNGVLPDYDPMPVLRELAVPQLWILGGQDIDAPYAETNRRLQKLQADGKPVSIVVYPEVEHGLYAFEEIGDERLSTRQPASLLPLLVDFARNGRLQEAYEAAVIRRKR
ncbi:MAG: alpha/beta hydrolase [Xanthomonadales bacterium]|nr:alpha/beta hydrolase [Xanthomonadales bacterium]